MTLYIKNMVCPRCIRAVDRSLTEAGVAVKNVQLGEAELVASPNAELLTLVREAMV